jgi:hypothetical protein
MLPKEMINYIFTYIQSNTNKIMKDYIKEINSIILNNNFSGEKIMSLYYFLCMRKCKYSCSLCNDTNIPNSFKLYSMYDNKLDFFRYTAYDIMFCSEECLDLWWTY